jgi:hypothetical protein
MKFNNNRSTQRIFEHCCSKDIIKTSLVVFVSLFLLVPSSGSIFYLSSTQDANAQQQQNTTPAGIAAATTSGTSSNPATTPVLPQSLRVTDISMGDAQLPLRASIINNERVGELADASQNRGKLGEYFPIVVFHFDAQPVGFEKGSTIIKHVLMGQIKSYDSADDVLEEANYWKDIPLDEKVALELDHPGLHYFVAAVEFANGTSGIYSGKMDADVIGIKPSFGEFIQFQLGLGETSGIVKTEPSDIDTSLSDPPFQRIASEIICSDLSDNGFQVCNEGEDEDDREDTILRVNDDEDEDDDTNVNDDNEDEDDDNEDEDERDDNSNGNGNGNGNDDEEREVRGDGGEGGRYDADNCTGKQCEDADKETEEERDSDDCEINPDLCKDDED